MHLRHHDNVPYPDNLTDVSLRLNSPCSLDKVTTHATPRFSDLLKQHTNLIYNHSLIATKLSPNYNE